MSGYSRLSLLRQSARHLVVVCRALVDRLVDDRAPHPLKLHHDSGSLFFPLREGRPRQMLLECGGVPVHFVHATFVSSSLGSRTSNCRVPGSPFRRALCASSKATT